MRGANGGLGEHPNDRCNDVIVAVVCTTFTPIIPTFLGKTILGMLTIRMSETIAFRPRQSKLLACTGGC